MNFSDAVSKAQNRGKQGKTTYNSEARFARLEVKVVLGLYFMKDGQVLTRHCVWEKVSAFVDLKSFGPKNILSELVIAANKKRLSIPCRLCLVYCLLTI